MINNNELRFYFQEYLLYNNFDNLKLFEVKDKLDKQLNNEKCLKENIVLFAYIYYEDYSLLKEDKYNDLRIIGDKYLRGDNTNMFELDKKFKKMFLETYKNNPKTKENLKKIYYWKLLQNEKIKKKIDEEFSI